MTGAASAEARDYGELTDAQLGAALRQMLTALSAAESLLPQAERSALLDLVVRTAANVLGAEAASLFLLDDTGRDLVFEVAIGPKAEQIAQLRVPLGHGIAGMVAVTGQPMAISSPRDDPRFAADIAQRIGHLPQSILCVPLRFGDTIIGVIEVLDKNDARPFTTDDIAVLSQFAEVAALATAQVRRHDDLRAALAAILDTWARQGMGTSGHAALQPGIDSVLASTRASAEYRVALEIALAIGEIAAAGEAERALCYDWLRRLQQYVRVRTMPLQGGRAWER